MQILICLYVHYIILLYYKHGVLTQIPIVLYVTFNLNRDGLSKHGARNKCPGANERVCEAPPFVCASLVSRSYCC